MKPLAFTPRRLAGHVAQQRHMVGNHGTEKLRSEARGGLLGRGRCWLIARRWGSGSLSRRLVRRICYHGDGEALLRVREVQRVVYGWWQFQPARESKEDQSLATWTHAQGQHSEARFKYPELAD